MSTKGPISSNDAADAAALASGVRTARNEIAKREEALERNAERGTGQTEASLRAANAKTKALYLQRVSENPDYKQSRKAKR